MTRRGQAATGEIKRTAGGWAIRYRDASGVRRQQGGFRLKTDAKAALDDELRKARLGPLFRPTATLDELVAAYMKQYVAEPASHNWLSSYLKKATAEFGDQAIGSIGVQQIAQWRAGMPLTMRHGAHRALRQVMAAAVAWGWLDRDPSVLVKNPMHPRAEFVPFATWEDVDLLAEELGSHFGPLAIFMVGTGLRPEEAFGLNWSDVDLQAGALTVRRAFAKGRLKTYAKTAKSRRRVPLRGKVVRALESMERQNATVFPASGGGRVNIDNFRSREWNPALRAAGLDHRRIYDMRHTFAAWSLAAGMSIFALARRMGTSVQVIDSTYGHLLSDAEDHDRALLDSYDEKPSGHVVGTVSGDKNSAGAAER